MLVIACSNGKDVGKKLAKRLGASYSELYKEIFPDGELHLRFNVNVKEKEVVLVQSTAPSPNDNLLELVFAIKTAKELGASKVSVVAPYFCYMRQDNRFHPGEIKSNTIASHLIQHAGADEFYTVAGHLHRVNSLRELFSIPAYNLHVFDEMALWVKKNFGKNVVIVGPDIESWRVGKHVAQMIGCEYDTFLKKRLSGRKIHHTSLAHVNAKGKDVVIIDDIVSTGGTVIGAARHLKKMGAKSVSCVCVHLMSDAVGQKLLKNGIKKVAASNTVKTKYSVLDASATIANIMRNQSVLIPLK